MMIIGLIKSCGSILLGEIAYRCCNEFRVSAESHKWQITISVHEPLVDSAVVWRWMPCFVVNSVMQKLGSIIDNITTNSSKIDVGGQHEDIHFCAVVKYPIINISNTGWNERTLDGFVGPEGSFTIYQCIAGFSTIGYSSLMYNGRKHT